MRPHESSLSHILGGPVIWPRRGQICCAMVVGPVPAVWLVRSANISPGRL